MENEGVCLPPTGALQPVETQKPKRKYYLDFLRIIACFLVIVNHTNSQIFLNSDIDATWFISVLYFIVCRIAVPVYIMISGALLLKKEESYKDLFFKRILRIVLDLIIASFVYYCINCLSGKATFGIVDFLYTMFRKPVVTPLWYFYMYLGLMVMLPLLRKLVKAMSDKDFLYIFIIHCVFVGILPIITHYCNLKPMSSNFQLPLANAYIIWFILGYYIENRMDKKYFNKKILISSIVVSVVLIIFAVGMMYYDKVMQSEKNMYIATNTLIVTLITSLTSFYAAKYISLNPKKKEHKYTFVKSLSGCTLGIYMIHPIFTYKQFNLFYEILVKMNVPRIISMVIYEVLIFAVCYLITFILKKIPVVKKLL